MLIDFHTHIYPDALAERIMIELSQKAIIKPCSNGNKNGQENIMKNMGIDKIVALSIATNAKQTPKVNAFAKSLQNENIIPFGSVHPDSETLEEDFAQFLSFGFKGLKLHPEYQNFFVGGDNCYKVIELCKKHNIIVVIHAGKDIGFPGSLNSPPCELAKLVDTFTGCKIVLAHMGGFQMSDDVIKYLVGKDCYLDTAFITKATTKSLAKEIIRIHGDDKILFGSDCPWEHPRDTYEYILSLNLSNQTECNIFYKNAHDLLNL